MKRQFRTLIGLSIAAALPVLAAENDSVRVTVPFVFTAGAATLPAGDYVISQQLDSHFLTIEGKGGAAILIAIPEARAGELRMSNVTFERNGKTNTLMEVRMYGKPSAILSHPVGR
jgi:hypothetical protein